MNEKDRIEWREKARTCWTQNSDDLQVDDNAQVLEPADDGTGAWVQAWVWTPRSTI